MTDPVSPARRRPRLIGPSSICVATYNLHRCIGADGQQDVARVARVLRELGAGIVAAQEVESDSSCMRGDCQTGQLASMTGMHAVSGPTFRRRGSHYGNVLLTRFPVVRHRQIDLSMPGKEPRGAIDVDLDVYGRTVRVTATHLGLGYRERLRQATRLLDAVRPEDRPMTLLLGDFNEWAPWSAVLRMIRARFGLLPAPRTFPSRMPLAALDRIWVHPRAAAFGVSILRSPLTRRASDHLPVTARIRLDVR